MKCNVLSWAAVFVVALALFSLPASAQSGWNLTFQGRGQRFRAQRFEMDYSVSCRPFRSFPCYLYIAEQRRA